MININQAIPILSLIIAALAVFFGPLISLSITRKTLKLNSNIAAKNLISPMRQKWISELRDAVAELTSRSHYYAIAGVEDRSDEEYYRIIELEYKIKLLINPNEDDHKQLVNRIKEMTVHLYKMGVEAEIIFWERHHEVIEISQAILKREWERVKNDI